MIIQKSDFDLYKGIVVGSRVSIVLPSLMKWLHHVELATFAIGQYETLSTGLYIKVSIFIPNKGSSWTEQ